MQLPEEESSLPPTTTVAASTTFSSTSHPHPHPHPHPHKRKYNASSAKTAVSGATLGSICAYVQRYGTPYQCSKVVILVHKLLELQKEAYFQEKQTKKRKLEGENVEVENYDIGSSIPWSKLKHELYELAGPFLWKHAVHHWKTCIAPQMRIPVALQEEVLKLDEHGEKGEEEHAVRKEGEKDTEVSRSDDGGLKNEAGEKDKTVDAKEGEESNKEDTNSSKGQECGKTSKDSTEKKENEETKELRKQEELKKSMFASTAGIWNGWSLDLISSPQNSQRHGSDTPMNKTDNDATAAASVSPAAMASESKSETTCSAETNTQSSLTAEAVNRTAPTKIDIESAPRTTAEMTPNDDPTKSQEKQGDSSLMPPPQNVPKTTTVETPLPSPPDPLSPQKEHTAATATTPQSVILPDNHKKGFLNFAEYDFGNSSASNTTTSTNPSSATPAKQEQQKPEGHEKENEQGYQHYFQENWNTTLGENKDDDEKNDHDKSSASKGNASNHADESTTPTANSESPTGHNTRKRRRVDYAAMAQTEDGDDENDDLSKNNSKDNNDAGYTAITAAVASHIRKRLGQEFTSSYIGVYKRRGSGRGDKEDYTMNTTTSSHAGAGGEGDDDHDVDEKIEQHHPIGKHWTAQCVMRYGGSKAHANTTDASSSPSSPQTKHKKSSNFHIGKYDTEQEAAFAVDLMQTFFHPEGVKQDASSFDRENAPKAADEIAATSRNNESDKAEGIRNRRKFKLNLSTTEQCESIWEPHLKEYGWLRTADVVDVKLRPALRKIVHAAVMEWSSSSCAGGDTSGQQQCRKDEKAVVKDDDSKNIASKEENKEGEEEGKEKCALESVAAEEEDCEEDKIDVKRITADTSTQPSSTEIADNNETKNEMDVDGEKDDSVVVINDNSAQSDDVEMINSDDRKYTASDVGDDGAVLVDDDDIKEGNDDTMDGGDSSSSVAVVEENIGRDSPSSANNDSGSVDDSDEVQNIDVIDLS